MGTAVPVNVVLGLRGCTCSPLTAFSALSCLFYFIFQLHELSLAVTADDLVLRGHRVTILMNILLWLVSSKITNQFFWLNVSVNFSYHVNI